MQRRHREDHRLWCIRPRPNQRPETQWYKDHTGRQMASSSESAVRLGTQEGITGVKTAAVKSGNSVTPYGINQDSMWLDWVVQ